MTFTLADDNYYLDSTNEKIYGGFKVISSDTNQLPTNIPFLNNIIPDYNIYDKYNNTAYYRVDRIEDTLYAVIQPNRSFTLFGSYQSTTPTTLTLRFKAFYRSPSVQDFINNTNTYWQQYITQTFTYNLPATPSSQEDISITFTTPKSIYEFESIESSNPDTILEPNNLRFDDGQVLFLNQNNTYIVGRGCDLSNLNLSGSDMTGCDLRGCDLSGTILADVILTNVLVDGSTILPTQYDKVYDTDGHFLSLDQEEGDRVENRRVDRTAIVGWDVYRNKVEISRYVRKADVSGWLFQDVDFSRMDFRKFVMKGTRFVGVNLSDVYLPERKHVNQQTKFENITINDLDTFQKLNPGAIVHNTSRGGLTIKWLGRVA
jgi:uncharacterized protein YjbI with pentapeptide repeats